MPEVRRELTLDAEPDAVWGALSTEEGLASWLAERVEGEIAAGERAVFTYADGEEREAHIEEVRDGEHVVWRWSRAGYEESRVVVAVAREGAGSRVTVTETASEWQQLGARGPIAAAGPVGFGRDSGAAGRAVSAGFVGRDGAGRFVPGRAVPGPDWWRALKQLGALPLGRVALCA